MKDFEAKIQKYLKERDWMHLKPGDLAKSISIESGELLELFQWSNPDLEEVKKDKEKMAQISAELADVMIYCFDLSSTLGLNTQKILEKKLAAARKKYPAKLRKNRSDKGDANDIYWKIKKEHRMKGLS